MGHMVAIKTLQIKSENFLADFINVWLSKVGESFGYEATARGGRQRRGRPCRPLRACAGVDGGVCGGNSATAGSWQGRRASGNQIFKLILSMELSLDNFLYITFNCYQNKQQLEE